ncbi:MAG: GTP-binding protein [Verrucomicrobiota bacterium]
MNMVENGPMGETQADQLAQRNRCIFINGFFGAGKTTAISKLGAYLHRKGMQPSICTRDQGEKLVDIAAYRAQGLEVNEPDGAPTQAPDGELFGHHIDSPGDGNQVIITESGGNCSGLCNFSKEHLDRSDYVLAPLTVMVDPARLSRVFGLDAGQGFSEIVNSLYRKQIEEADCIVLNKIDLFSESKLEQIESFLLKKAPETKLFWVSARSGEGLKQWFDYVLGGESEIDCANPRGVDGITDAASAKLAWLNCSVRLSSVKYWESSRLVLELAAAMQSILRNEKAEIAHLKLSFTPDEPDGAGASVSVTRNDATPELWMMEGEPVQSGNLLLNARAEAEPEILNSSFNRALLALAEKTPHLFARLEHCEHFRPIRPGQSDIDDN